MGSKDNPRRTSKKKTVSLYIALVLVLGGGLWLTHWVLNHLTEQEQLLMEYQDRLVEQGSLIDQQNEQLLNQKDTLTHTLLEAEKLQGTLEEQEQLHTQVTEQHEKDKASLREQRDALKKDQGELQQRIEELEDALAFKQAKAKEAAAAAAKQKSSAPKVQPVSSPAPAAPKKPAAVQQVAAKSSVPSRSTAPKGRVMMVESTGYIAMCDTGCTGITATGIDLRNQPHLKVIAVDPSVIPLGTKVWVEGYGHAVAGDTGGAIKGNKIDLHFPTTAAAVAWGRRTVQIRILN